jgi:hypothetical protein
MTALARLRCLPSRSFSLSSSQLKNQSIYAGSQFKEEIYQSWKLLCASMPFRLIGTWHCLVIYEALQTLANTMRPHFWVLWVMEFGTWWFIRLADSRSDCANPLNYSITDCNFWRIWLCGGTRWCCFVCAICPNDLPFISICSHLGLLPCVWKFHSQSSYSFQQNDMCDELLYMDSGQKKFRTQEAFNLTEIPITFSSVCILYDSWTKEMLTRQFSCVLNIII